MLYARLKNFVIIFSKYFHLCNFKSKCRPKFQTIFFIL